MFAIQLSFLLRSDSRLKCDPYTGSQTVRSSSSTAIPPECPSQVLRPPQEDSKDHARNHSDYAHNFPQNTSKLSEFDLESHMLQERDTEKVKRSENKVCTPVQPQFPTLARVPSILPSRVFSTPFPSRPCSLTRNQFYGFLRRGRLASRSAPKKRRSRSADEIMEMVEPLQSAISLADGGHSVQDHGPTFATPPIKYGPIASPLSRPLSTATVTPKRPNKNLPKLPPDNTMPTPPPVMSSTHVIGEPEHPKSRKRTFFGMITIPGSRRSSVSKSRPSTPHSTLPDSSFNSRHQRKPDHPVPSPSAHRHDLSSIPLNNATNFRWNADVAGQRSQPSFDISEPDSGLGIETVVTNAKLVTIVSPQTRSHLGSVPDVSTRASSTQPKTGPGFEKSRRQNPNEGDRPWRHDSVTSGRSSPLVVLANSKMFGGKKGKEREQSVDRGRDTKTPTSAPIPENERGRESQGSNREQGRQGAATNISGPMNLKLARGRIKHGSFDFERPLSTSVGYPVRSARWSASGSYRGSSETERSLNGNGNGQLWNGPSSSTYPIQEERPSLTRSRSAREPNYHNQDRDRGQPKIRFADETKGGQTRSRSPYDPRSRTQPQPQHSSLPSKSTGRGLGVLKNGHPTQPQTNLPYRPEGGSWGRNTSRRAGLGGTGFTDGLPTFGMSATSLHQNGGANGRPPRSGSPQAATVPMDRAGMKRHTMKGRSLDLGLGLNWAPTRVKEEAVMDFSEMGVRSKWREEAEMKESGRKKVLESFEQVLGDNGSAKFRECTFTNFPFRVPRLTLVLVCRCPTLRRKVDTPRWTVRADAQGQTVARYLSERYGHEEERGTPGEARSCRPVSTMITTPTTSISTMPTPGFFPLIIYMLTHVLRLTPLIHIPCYISHLSPICVSSCGYTLSPPSSKLSPHPSSFLYLAALIHLFSTIFFIR